MYIYMYIFCILLNITIIDYYNYKRINLLFILIID